jgi:hypothetical protein
MAKAKVEKITLSQSRDIPFDRLVLSSRNVRRVRAGVSIAELAEDIARRAHVEVANDNAPGQVVLSGPERRLAEAAGMTRDLGGRAVLLEVAGPFHTPAMRQAATALRDALDDVELREPSVPVVANVTASPFRSPEDIRRLLVEQLTARVRFRESIAWMSSQGAEDFDDLGPGKVVEGLARKMLREVIENDPQGILGAARIRQPGADSRQPFHVAALDGLKGDGDGSQGGVPPAKVGQLYDATRSPHQQVALAGPVVEDERPEYEPTSVNIEKRFSPLAQLNVTWDRNLRTQVGYEYSKLTSMALSNLNVTQRVSRGVTMSVTALWPTSSVSP